MASKIIIDGDRIFGVYDDRLRPLYDLLGINLSVKRASRVDFDHTSGDWVASLPSGREIARCKEREKAIALEVEYLEARLLPPIFKDLPEFPGYKIGSDGSIWSQWERVSGRAQIGSQWKELKPIRLHPSKWKQLSYRYPRVCLRRIDGKHPSPFIHYLVLTAFAGTSPAGQQGRHLNGNEMDNALSNLAWGTSKENRADQVRHKTDCSGSRNGMAKLTGFQVKQIKEQAAMGVRKSIIAEQYKVHPCTIRRIVRGQRKAY